MSAGTFLDQARELGLVGTSIGSTRFVELGFEFTTGLDLLVQVTPEALGRCEILGGQFAHFCFLCGESFNDRLAFAVSFFVFGELELGFFKILKSRKSLTFASFGFLFLKEVFLLQNQVLLAQGLDLDFTHS